MSETCRFTSQNKFVKLVHLVGFITKKKVQRGLMAVTLLTPRVRIVSVDSPNIIAKAGRQIPFRHLFST